MKRDIQLGYYIHSGVNAMLKHKALTLTSIATTTACLLLISFMLMLSINIGYNMRQFQVENVMLAFIDDTLTEEEARSLETNILRVDHVKTATFISREEAFEDYASQYEDAATDHLQPSVFRNRFAVEIDRQEDAGKVSEELLSINGIADTRVDETVSSGFAIVKKAVNILGVFTGTMLLTLSVVIMTNMIKTTTYTRSEEIAVMKMMGAYDSFIKSPFIVEGCIVGLAGSLTAFAVSLATYSLLGKAMGSIGIASLLDVLPFNEMAYAILAADAFLGLAVGVTGSLIALRKYLRV